MKTLYLDCSMGASGDMLTAALWELLPDREGFEKKLNSLNIPSVSFHFEPSVKCGITGTHSSVLVDGEEEHIHHHDEEHHHHHDEEHHHRHHHSLLGGHDHHEHREEHHHHHHHHASLEEIYSIVDGLNVSDRVKSDVKAVYDLIAGAESTVHGRPVSEVHFHEVGTKDAIADITAVCMLMEELSPERVVVSPINVGGGTVECAHGTLPVPAPATALILQGMPIYGGNVESELCTPTGAALLRHFAGGFGHMPEMTVSACGYGMGRKDFEQANCLRAVFGESESAAETVYELSCNVDDMTPEQLGFALEELLSAGALEAFTTSAGMKKSRPGVLLTALCRDADREKIVKLIFKHTTTIGIREKEVRRYSLKRRSETVETKYGSVRVKVSEGWGVVRKKPEYDDLASLARSSGASLEDIRREIDGI